MAAAREKRMAQAKRRIKEKLDMIEEEKQDILQYVNTLTDKAEVMGHDLMDEEDRAMFMQRFMPVMQRLEQTLNTLFLVQAGLPDQQELEDLMCESISDEKGSPVKSGESHSVTEVKQEVVSPEKVKVDCQTVVKEEINSPVNEKSPEVEAVLQAQAVMKEDKLTPAKENSPQLEVEVDTSVKEIHPSVEGKMDTAVKEKTLLMDATFEPKAVSTEEKGLSTKEENFADSVHPSSVSGVVESVILGSKEQIPGTSHEVENIPSLDLTPVDSREKQIDPTLREAQAEFNTPHHRSYPVAEEQYIPDKSDYGGEIVDHHFVTVPKMPTTAPKQAEEPVLVVEPIEVVSMEHSPASAHVPVSDARSGAAPEVGVQHGREPVTTIKEHEARDVRSKPLENQVETCFPEHVSEKSQKHSCAATSKVDAATETAPKKSKKEKKSKSSKSKESDAHVRMILNSLGIMSSKTFEKAKGSHKSRSHKKDATGNAGSEYDIDVRSLQFEGSNCFNVLVVYIESPSIFWVQPRASGRQSPVDNLMTQLQLYQSRLKPSDSGFLLPIPPQPGMVVCAKFSDGNWYRARVVTRYNPGTKNQVEVFYIDYGNRHMVLPNEIRPLPLDFSYLPAQAFPCALKGVMPGDGSSYWTETETWHFGGLTLNNPNIYGMFSIVEGCKVTFAELYIPEQIGVAMYTNQGAIVNNLSDVGELMLHAHKGRKANPGEIVFLIEEGWAKEISTQKSSDVHSFLPQMKLIAMQCPHVVQGPHYHEWVKTGAIEDVTSNGLDKNFLDLMQKQFQATSTSPTMSSAAVPDLPAEGRQVAPSAGEVEGQNYQEVDISCDSVYSQGSSTLKQEVIDQRVVEILDQERVGTVSKSASDQPKLTSSPQHGKVAHSYKGSKVKKTGCKVSTKSNENQEVRSIKLCDKPHEKQLPPHLPKSCQFYQKYETWMGTTKNQHVAESSKKVDQSRSLPDTDPHGTYGGFEVDHAVDKDSVLNTCISDTGSIGKASVSDHVEGALSADTCHAESGLVDSDSEAMFQPLEVSIHDDGFITFLMSMIHSPGKFFIHLLTEDSQSAVDILQKELEHHYVKTKQGHLSKLSANFEPRIGDICCARFTEDGSFYRAEVLQFRYGSPPGTQGQVRLPSKLKSPKSVSKTSDESGVCKVEVYYIDFGNVEWVSRTRVYPLPHAFWAIPPQAVPCCLAQVSPIKLKNPVDNENTEHPKPVEKPWIKDGWLEEACKDFVEMTGYKDNLLGFVVGDNVAGTVMRPSRENPLPLIVVNTSGADDMSVNDELVRLGFANTSAKLDVVEEQQDQEIPVHDDENVSMDIPDHWNPMMDDYLSERNSYALDLDDAHVAVTGYKASDERICRFFARGQKCYSGDFCRYEHIRPGDGVAIDKAQVFCVYDVENTIAPPEENSWVSVNVTAIFNPGHFFVNFPFGTRSVEHLMQDELCGDEGYVGISQEETLDSVMQEMRDHYSHKVFRDKDMTTYAPGEIIACKFSQDQRWYRGKVIDVDPDQNRVEVFYVDFGNKEWIDESDTRQMEPRFLHLPFQTLECYLPLDPSGEQWSSEARELFYELVHGKILFAHVRNKSINNILTVDLYDSQPEEEIFINQVLLDRDLAIPPDPKLFDILIKRKSHRSSASSSGVTSRSLSRTSSLSSPVYLPG